MTPDGMVTVLHVFNPTTEGAAPFAALVQGTDGNFYGTTRSAGPGGFGSVFQMTPDGATTVLHAFNGDDGSAPWALIQATDGNFYGTTANGGSAGMGVVFGMDSTGSVSVLHNFTGADGAFPQAGLLQGSDGNLYGTAQLGSDSDSGVVFYLTGPSTSSGAP
jgi:uncharacterized repeat protein (TIGR03803 family)